jgi:hypothetical protein
MRYFRVHTNENAFTTQLPRGLFVAVGRLVDSKTMNDPEIEEYRKNRAWFEANLPVPRFYASGNSEKAVTWFKDTTEGHAMYDKMGFYRRMAEKYGIELWITTALETPGRVIYEDDYQIAVVDSRHSGEGFETTPLV